MDLQKWLEIEDKYDLNDLRIDEFPYWTYFRFDIHNIIQSALELDESANHKKSRTLFEIVGTLLNIINPPFYKTRKCDCLFASVGRRVKIDSLFYSTYVDPVMSEYPDSLLIEFPDAGKHFKPAYTPRIYFFDRAETMAEIIGYINMLLETKEYRCVFKRISESLENPLVELCNAYDVEIDWSDTIARIARYWFVYCYIKKFYDRFLERVRPRILVLGTSYGRAQMTLIERCKCRNIPTVDIQHGTIERDNLPYSYPAGCNISHYPDYIMLWSDYWKHLASFPISKEHLISVGFPYAEMRMKNLKARDDGGKQTVLFLSQYNIGPYLADIACELDKIIDKEHYRLIFKMHPEEYDEWPKRYGCLIGTDIEIAADHSRDLYELFGEATHIVGIGGTTALFEGLMFDVRAYVCAYQATDTFIDLCKEGYAQLFESADDLKEMIMESTDSKVESLRFWEKDSLNNIRRVIDEIMEGRL